MGIYVPMEKKKKVELHNGMTQLVPTFTITASGTFVYGLKGM